MILFLLNAHFLVNFLYVQTENVYKPRWMWMCHLIEWSRWFIRCSCSCQKCTTCQPPVQEIWASKLLNSSLFLPFGHVCGILILTVFPRVSNDNRRFWTQPKVIDGLNFELVRSESICIIDVVFKPFSGCVLPLFSGVLPSPPHQILQVGPVPLSVGQRLKAWLKWPEWTNFNEVELHSRGKC